MNGIDTLIYDNYTVNYTCTSLEPSTNYSSLRQSLNTANCLPDKKFVELRTPLERNY